MSKWLIVSVMLLALVAGTLAALRSYLSGYVRRRAISTLGERFDSSVSISSLKVSLFPGIRIEGEGIALRHQGRTDIPPLIRIRKFSAETGLGELLRRPHHLTRVYLEGLRIAVPPRGERSKSPRQARKRFPVVVDEIVADNSELDMLPTKGSSKPSHTFLIHHLVLHDAGLGRAMSFSATLTNPKPKGEIQTRGSLGPWHTDDPSLTRLNATYTFTHANLATFRGIAGMLSSKGKFGGVLSRGSKSLAKPPPQTSSSAWAASPYPLRRTFTRLSTVRMGTPY